MGLRFEWDAAKARVNLRKHGVDFADAATALHDEMAITLPDDDPEEERLSPWQATRCGEGSDRRITPGGTLVPA